MGGRIYANPIKEIQSVGRLNTNFDKNELFIMNEESANEPEWRPSLPPLPDVPCPMRGMIRRPSLGTSRQGGRKSSIV